MLEYIVDNIASKVASNFEKVIPLAEIVKTGEKSYPAEYISKGNYTPVNPDNFLGLGYFRLTGNPEITIAETKRPEKDVMKYSYPFKFVGCIKKDVLGKDDSFSANALCIVLAKRLEENNTSLKSTLGANKATVKVSAFNFDMLSILGDEFKGIENLTKGIPLDYCLVSIDLKVEIEIRNSCIGIICNDYCGGISPVLTNTSSSLVRGSNIKFVNPFVPTVSGVYAYSIPELNGKTILIASLNNIILRSDQYSQSGNTFTITDTEADIYTGMELRIGYLI